MFSLSEIIIFLILEFLLINRLSRYCIKHNLIFLNNVVIKQNLVLIALLFITHIYSYFYYRAFPGLNPDGLEYDVFAKAFANNLRSLHFAMPNKEFVMTQINSTSLLKSTLNNNIDLPFLSYGIGGIIYTIFGYSPLLVKFLNIIFFQVSTIIFFKILNTTSTISKSIFYIYAFNPIFLMFSVSLIKEASILLCTIWFFYSVIINSKKNIILSLLILFFLRPYLTPIYLLALIIATFKNNIKSLLVYSSLFILIYIFIDLFLSKIPYSKALFSTSYQITNNTGKAVIVHGIGALFSLLISNPIAYIKYIFYYFTLAFFSPEIWVPKYLQMGVFGKYPYALSFDGIAELIQAPLQLYILYKIFDNWVGIRNFIRENLIYIISFIVLVSFNAIRSGVVRYQESVTLTIFLIFANFKY